MKSRDQTGHVDGCVEYVKLLFSVLDRPVSAYELHLR